MYNLFVYGTLRHEGSNHHFLKGARRLSKSGYVPGELHDTGLGYPVLKEGRAGKVWGELYQINKEQLENIDLLEGYSPANYSNEYIRVVREVRTENRTIEAFVYIVGDQLAGCVNRIKSGDWLMHIQNKH